MPEPTPIRPGTTVRTERAVQLIEHVAKVLTEFPEMHDGEEPRDIVIVVRGAEGTMQSAWFVGNDGDDSRPVRALAGAILTSDAVSE